MRRDFRLLLLAFGAVVHMMAPAFAQGEPAPKRPPLVKAQPAWVPLDGIRRRVRDVREEQIDALEISGRSVSGYLAPYSIQVGDRGLIRTFLKALQQAEVPGMSGMGATHGGPEPRYDPGVMLRLKKSEPLAASQEGPASYTDDADNDLTAAYDRLQFAFPGPISASRLYGPTFGKALERLQRYRVVEARAAVARVEKDVVAYQHCDSGHFRDTDRGAALKRIPRVTDPEKVHAFVQALKQVDSRAFTWLDGSVTWPVTRLELRDGSSVDLHLALEEGGTRAKGGARWLLTLFDELTKPVPLAEAAK